MSSSASSKKRSMMTYALIAVAILLGLFVLVIMLRPSGFRVSRSITIDAPAEVVFSQVDELRRWQAWSPWEKLDSNMQRTFEGPDRGVGAVYRWDGSGQVGAGRNIIVESRPNELVKFRLEMLRPFVGSNDVEFAFIPVGDATTVNWTMTGQLNFMTKIMDLLIGMDSMVGTQFQQGLEQLKSVSEQQQAN